MQTIYEIKVPVTQVQFNAIVEVIMHCDGLTLAQARLEAARGYYVAR